MKNNVLSKNYIRKFAAELTPEDAQKLDTLQSLAQQRLAGKIYDLDSNKDIALLLSKYMDKKAPFRLRHPNIAGIPNNILGGLGTAAILAPQMLLPIPMAFAPLLTGESLNNRAELKAVKNVYNDYKDTVLKKNPNPEYEHPPLSKEDLKFLLKGTVSALKR